MGYSLSDEQLEFRDTLRRFLAEASPPAEVRRLIETETGVDEKRFNEKVWKQMADDLGLQGIAIPERFGGQGFGAAELGLAMAEMGRSLLPSPFFSSVVLAGGAIAQIATESEKAELLGDIAAGGTATLAFLEPAGSKRGSTEPTDPDPALPTHPDPTGWNAENIALVAAPDGDGVRLSGRKSFVLDGHTARHIVVAARVPGSTGDAGIGIFLVEGDAPGLVRTRLATLDATRTQARLDFDSVPARALGSAGPCWPALRRALCEAEIALAAEMTGGFEFVLETAVAYAKTRHQFGRAIGSFQAIKHKCADLHILLEGARSAVRSACQAVDENDPELPMLASIAKAHCGDAFELAARENIQIHGGVGFTWEYDAHLYLRRALSSRTLLGDTTHHRERVARLLEEETERSTSRRDLIIDTPEEAAFRAEVRTWLETHAELLHGEDSSSSHENWSTGPFEHTPEAEAIHFERCRRWQQEKFDGGWAGITWPEAYGGRGGTAAESLIFSQEEAAFDVTSGFLPATIALVGPALMRHGDETKRLRYLRPLLRGDEAWCQLFSEPEAGSDLAAVRMRAVRDGDVFVVNGQKLWTTSAQFCDFGILLVRTNPDAVKHAGITFLLVDMKTPGIEVRPLPTIKGDRHFNEVFFTDVRISAENVVGEIDAGWTVAKTTLANESAMIGTGRQGQGDTAALVRSARESGRWREPVVRQQIAEVYIEERTLGFLQDRLQDAILAGRMPDVDGSVLKILWAESRSRKAYVGLALQGPAGMLAGSDAVANGYWQDQVLDRSMGTVGGGTVEVHRNGIGERVLGLPKEPRVDRDVPFKRLESGHP